MEHRVIYNEPDTTVQDTQKPVLKVSVQEPTTVNMVGKEVARALAELKLTALLLGQGLDESHYVENDTGGHTHLATDAKRTLRLPGVAMSQLDPRNQLLLKGASVVLTGLPSTAKPQHDVTLTSRGKHGTHKGDFFASPVFLGKRP